jgi:catechol-2,3-dioxygenase
MLSDNDAVATVAVRNLESARTFYEQTLGLTKIMENEEAFVIAIDIGLTPCKIFVR